MGDTTLNRHPRKALTAKFVESIKIKGKYFDGHGLFLRVTPNGTKQWVQRITINGKRTEIGLGSAIVIPLSMARKNALENYISAKSGQNGTSSGLTELSSCRLQTFRNPCIKEETKLETTQEEGA